MKPKTLRDHLQSAVNQRTASLWTQRCHRKDIDALRASIGRAQVFLGSYTSDQSMCEWIRTHLDDMGRIRIGNAGGPLWDVYLGYLKERNQQMKRA
jgi:hypothetical protein